MNWISPLLIGLAFLITSCQSKPTPEYDARIDGVLKPRRPASLAYWEDKTIRGLKPSNYAEMVTALVLPPGISLEMQQITLPGGRQSMKIKAKGRELFMGSAVPVSDDGYFLTAAHNLEGISSLILLAPAKTKVPGVSRARVVWKSGSVKDGPDLALIHVPLAPFAPMTMAQPATLEAGTPVLASGYASNKPGQSGGRILSLSKMEGAGDGARWRRLGHSAPLAHGDSGGPLMGADGSLLGVNTAWAGRVVFPLGLNQIWGYQGLAVSPDPDWINSLIDQDRQQHPMKPRKSGKRAGS